MNHADRSDRELLTLAREGAAPAYAVLLHRYGHEILDLAAHDADPVGATTATFVRGMRQLHKADDSDVRAWLLTQAMKEIDGQVVMPEAQTAEGPPKSRDAAAGSPGPQLGPSSPTSDDMPYGPALVTDDTLDDIWAELALRWPSGRVPRYLPSWVIWLVTTILLLVIAVALPWVVLGRGTTEDTVQQLRAIPMIDELNTQQEPIEPGVEEPLPTSEFPSAPDVSVSQTPSSSQTGTPPAVDPAPQPPVGDEVIDLEEDETDVADTHEDDGPESLEGEDAPGAPESDDDGAEPNEEIDPDLDAGSGEPADASPDDPQAEEVQDDHPG